jgi:DUF177 domain-containing protein
MPEKTTPKQHATRRVDPRSPFVIDVREVGRRPGAMRTYRRSLPAPAGLGLDIIRVPEGAPLDVDLRLESVTEGVLLTGSATGPLTGDCGRCLEPVSDELVVDFRELFAYPDSTTDETTEQDEVHRLDGDYLDAEPVVRDAIVLGLPFTPLCRPDCAGLCPTCGQRLDDLPGDHTHEVLDPRWAALAAFTDAAQGDPETPADAPRQLD